MIRYVLMLLLVVVVFTVSFNVASIHRNEKDSNGEVWLLMKNPTVVEVDTGSVVVCDTITGIATCKKIYVPDACSDTFNVGYKISDFPGFVKKVEVQNREELKKSISELWCLSIVVLVIILALYVTDLLMEGRISLDFLKRKKHKSKSKK